ncbi:MAG TPA: YedE family putative selenium transporter [Clostridia bacterium]|nr:YedE family putative selenium transporter [Clostridia bacterium]
MGKEKVLVSATGAVLGIMAIFLVLQGNPANMGYCIACFLRDISGGLGFHRAEVVQYVRPEILGLILGAFITAILRKDFKVVGGSSAFTRFTLAMVGMVGMLIFLGCPVRAVLRLSAGDLNAGVGILGLIVGIWVGVIFLNNGFTLGKAEPQNKANGYLFPSMALLLLIMLVAGSTLFFYSTEGPGSMHAPLLISLVSGLLLGVLAQRSHFCMIGGIRDFIFFRDNHLLFGFFALLVVAFIGNLSLGFFNLGFAGQPIAHTDGVWNFLGMALGGWASVLLGGCPLRQIVAGSEGNTDCMVTVAGFMAGAALAHNMGLAAGAGGVPEAGKYAAVLGFAVVFLISYFNVYANKRSVISFGQNN